MYTYTTPTITCTFAGVEFDQIDYARVDLKGKSYEILKVIPVSDIDTETGTTDIVLTQEETAAFGKGKLSIQARIHYIDGTVQATNIVYKNIDEVLDKVVI